MSTQVLGLKALNWIEQIGQVLSLPIDVSVGGLKFGGNMCLWYSELCQRNKKMRTQKYLVNSSTQIHKRMAFFQVYRSRVCNKTLCIVSIVYTWQLLRKASRLLQTSTSFILSLTILWVWCSVPCLLPVCVVPVH